MNRDEREAEQENVTGIDAAQAVALGALPAEIIAGDSPPPPVIDIQSAVDAAVSSATSNLRQWDTRILNVAYQATRPVVERYFRQQGKPRTRDEVKSEIRVRVKAYVTKYGVVIPSAVIIGSTPLEAVAADVCGAFSMKWTDFMPPQVKLAAKAAEQGNPQASSWLKKLFGRKSSSAPGTQPAAPAATAQASAAPAAAAAESSAGRWGRNLNTWRIPAFQGQRSYGYQSDSSRPRHRHHRHHRGHRRDGRNLNTQPSPTYNPALPIGPYNQPTTSSYNPNLPVSQYNVPPAYNPALPIGPYNQPTAAYNPALSAQVSEFAAAHAPASVPMLAPQVPTYNPYLPVSATNYPQQQAYNPNLPTSATNQPPVLPAPATYPDDGNVIYGDKILGSGDSLGCKPTSSLGAWLHQLNPLYWLKSPEERKLVDVQRQAWIDNAELQKKNAKRQEVLETGQKAVEARQAVLAAQARSAEIEQQLKSIETQVLGACHGEPLGIATIVGRAELVGKDSDDRKPDPFADDVDARDAAPVIAKVKKARQLNADNSRELAPICAKIQSGSPLSPEETSKVLILLARNEQLHEFRKSLVRGDAAVYTDNPSARKIQRHVVLGAVKAMTPTEQQMLTQIVTLSKQGNPNAQKALDALRAQGYAVTMGYAPPTAQVAGQALTPDEQKKLAALISAAKGGHQGALRAIAVLNTQGYRVRLGEDTYVGWGIDDAVKLALTPVTVPLKYVWKGTKAVGRALGITHGGQSAEQVRLGRLKAARDRARAAQARARAADAQSEAEYRAQQNLAAAADAEADAADAEATAKEAAMLTAEAQYLPGQTDEEAQAAAAAADSSGKSRPEITPLPPTPDTPETTKLKAARRARVARKNPLAAKILAKSDEDTPAGIKLRASMELYKKAENKRSRERKAVKAMVARAKKGDKQAVSDVQALKAAGLAVKAERRAGRHVARVAAYRATEAKVKAARARMEVAAADQLTRRSRAHQLTKVAKLERRAAAGNKPCQAIVRKHVALAKKGNPQSKKVVDALVLARHVRTTTPNRRERKNLRQASRLARRVSQGDKRALAQVRVIEAAAKHGNPNAKRAQERLRTAAALELALKTGAIVVPAAVVTASVAKKRDEKKKAAERRQLASVEDKVARKTASREEAVAGARAAAELGDREKAAELAATAATLPSAGEELRRIATVAAAAQAGNPLYRGQVERAQAWPPREIPAASRPWASSRPSRP